MAHEYIKDLLARKQQIGPDRPAYKFEVEGAPGGGGNGEGLVRPWEVGQEEFTTARYGPEDSVATGFSFVELDDGDLLVTYYMADDEDAETGDIYLSKVAPDAFFTQVNSLEAGEWQFKEVQNVWSGTRANFRSTLYKKPDGGLLLFTLDPGEAGNAEIPELVEVYEDTGGTGENFEHKATISEQTRPAEDRLNGDAITTGHVFTHPDTGDLYFVFTIMRWGVISGYWAPQSQCAISADGGDTWNFYPITEEWTTLTTAHGRWQVMGVGVFTQPGGEGRRLFAYWGAGTYGSGDARVFYSDDGGQSWTYASDQEMPNGGFASLTYNDQTGINYLLLSDPDMNDAVGVSSLSKMLFAKEPSAEIEPENAFDTPRPEVYRLDRDSPTGGTFDLIAPGGTETLPYDAETLDIRAALVSLYGSEDIRVRRRPGTDWSHELWFGPDVGEAQLDADLTGLEDAGEADLDKLVETRDGFWGGPLMPTTFHQLDHRELCTVTRSGYVGIVGKMGYADYHTVEVYGAQQDPGDPIVLPVKSISVDRGADLAGEARVVLDNKGGKYRPDQSGEWEHVLWPWRRVKIRLGYGDELVTVFTGLIDEVVMDSFPQQITLACTDLFKKATDQLITTPDGGHVVEFDGRVDEAVATLAAWAGFDEVEIEDCDVELVKEFDFETYADAFSYFAEMTGFEVFCDREGVFRFRPDDQDPEADPEHGFQEGQDIVRLSYTITDQDVYAEVIAMGQDQEADEALAVHHNVPLSDYYNIPNQKKIIVQANEADTEDALEAIAQTTRNQMARRVRAVEWEAIGLPTLDVGSVVQVEEQGSGISEIYRIRELSFDFQPGRFTMNIRAYWYAHEAEE